MKSIYHIIASYFHQTDKWLWAFCLGLSGFSVVLLGGIYYAGISADLTDTRKIIVQLAASGLGVVAAIFLSKFDYHILGKLWKLHVPLAYGLVFLTFLIGEGTQDRVGDKSWIRLPGGFTVQPTEFLKISFIVALAYHLFKLRDELNRPQNVLLLCLHGAIPVLLVHFQGDDGTALVFAAVFICMVFAAGVSWKYLLPAGVLGSVGLALAWVLGVINDYQKQRILALFDPNADLLGDLYQQYNAKLAIGSGQIWGKGIFSPNHKYVPVVHNDFIFAFIGESLGFIGCLAVLAAIAVLCGKLLADAQRAEDQLGRLICVGVFAMFASQAVINIGMCLMVLPVIGITLPFLSYGGTSVLASYMGLGLALSVYMNSSKTLFSE